MNDRSAETHLPPLPKNDHAFFDPEGEQPDILVWNARSMEAYAKQSTDVLLALVESQAWRIAELKHHVDVYRGMAAGYSGRITEQDMRIAELETELEQARMDYQHELAKQARGDVPPAAPLTFAAFRKANVERCIKWHPQGIDSWSPSDWLTAVTGELGELASLLKMRNRERDGLAGNKFSPTQKQVADEIADVLTYLDLLAEVLGVDLASAAIEKFNEVSTRVGFTDRLGIETPAAPSKQDCTCKDTCARYGSPFPAEWSWRCQGLPYIPRETP